MGCPKKLSGYPAKLEELMLFSNPTISEALVEVTDNLGARS